MNLVPTTLTSVNSPHVPLRRNIVSLQSLCESELFKSTNFNPTNPNFYNAFAKDNEGTNEQKIALQLLLKKPTIDIAILPLFAEACDEYTTIIINALEKLLEERFSGELKETNDEISTLEKKFGLSNVFCALLSSFQNSELPESTREVTKSFLLKFISIEDVTVGCNNDEETVILLKKELYLTLGAITSLERSCDKAIRSSDHRVSEIHLNDYNQKKIQVMYSLVDQYTSTVQLIYSYLKNNVEQIDDVFLDDAINDFFNSHSYRCPYKEIFETLIVLSDNLTTKEEAKSFLDLDNELDLGSRLNQDCMDYLIKAVGNSKRPRSTFWLGCKYIEAHTSESVNGKHLRLICNYYNENIFDYFGRRYSLHDQNKRSDLKAIKYLSCVAITGYAPAIDVLCVLGRVTNCPDTLMKLIDIIETGQIIGFDDKEFAAELRCRMVQCCVNGHFSEKFDVYAEQKKFKNEQTYVKSLFSSYSGRTVLELLSNYDNKALGLEAKFEMGKYFFLEGGDRIFADTANGQELLENSARNGHVKAAVFVVHHYLYHTPHQPKFKSTYSAPEHSNFKALKFLDIAVKIACQNGKAEIAQNKIPDSLNEIVNQLDPTAREMIFSLSEQYERSKTVGDVKLADVLFKIALDAKQPAALKKLKRLEEELQKELAIKLQRKMEDLETQEKLTVVSL